MNLVALAVMLGFFLISLILHEVAHGATALYFGDSTAKDEGRLTLNPISHLDLFGSILLPAFLIFIGAPIFAWAKPVPVDFSVLNRKQTLLVSLAGVAVNFTLAITGSILIKLLPVSLSAATDLILMVVYINLLLGVFNLLPIPPLDGWRIWGVWLPDEVKMKIEANALLFLFLLIILFPYLPIIRIVKYLFTFLTGIVI